MKPEDNVAGQLMTFLEAMGAVRDAVDGYRADMAARGYSPTAAEAMAMDFHRHLLNVAFSQVGAKRD